MPRRWGRKYYDSGNFPEYNYPEDQPNPPRKFREKLSLIFGKNRVAISDKWFFVPSQ